MNHQLFDCSWKLIIFWYVRIRYSPNFACYLIVKGFRSPVSSEIRTIAVLVLPTWSPTCKFNMLHPLCCRRMGFLDSIVVYWSSISVPSAIARGEGPFRTKSSTSSESPTNLAGLWESVSCKYILNIGVDWYHKIRIFSDSMGNVKINNANAIRIVLWTYKFEGVGAQIYGP